MAESSTSVDSEAFRVRVELAVAGVELWRELRVPLDATFEDLHHGIQAACGWEERHLYAFYASAGAAGEPRRLQLLDAPQGITGDPDWGRYPLDAWWTSALRASHPEVVYVYDFGDGWRHRLSVTRERVPGAPAWELLDGAGHFPPEDCGGPITIEAVLEQRAAADPSKSEAFDDEFLAHLADWDPHAPLDLAPSRAQLVEATSLPWVGLEDPEVLGPGEWSWRELVLPRPDDRALSMARRQWLVLVANSARQHSPERWVDSWILCTRRPARRVCGAFVQLNLSDDGSRAVWRCPACGDSGAVLGCKLDAPTAEPADRGTAGERVDLRLPAEDYWALMTSDQPPHLNEELLLAAEGLPGRGMVRLDLSPSDLEDVFEWACAVANHETSPKRRKRVERICDLLEVALD